MAGVSGRINSYRIHRQNGLSEGEACLWVLRPEGGARHGIISDNVDFGPMGLEFMRAWRSDYRPYERLVILAKTTKYRRIRNNEGCMYNPRWIVAEVLEVVGINRYKVRIVKDMFITSFRKRTREEVEAFCEYLAKTKEPK